MPKLEAAVTYYSPQTLTFDLDLEALFDDWDLEIADTSGKTEHHVLRALGNPCASLDTRQEGVVTLMFTNPQGALYRVVYTKPPRPEGVDTLQVFAQELPFPLPKGHTVAIVDGHRVRVGDLPTMLMKIAEAVQEAAQAQREHLSRD